MNGRIPESTFDVVDAASPLTPVHTDDRCCPNCGEIALAFDPGTDRTRCRQCEFLF